MRNLVNTQNALERTGHQRTKCWGSSPHKPEVAQDRRTGAKGTGGHRCPEVDLPTEGQLLRTKGPLMKPKVLAVAGARKLTCRPKVKQCDRRSADDAEGLRSPMVTPKFQWSSDDAKGSGILKESRGHAKVRRRSEGCIGPSG